MLCVIMFVGKQKLCEDVLSARARVHACVHGGKCVIEFCGCVLSMYV